MQASSDKVQDMKVRLDQIIKGFFFKGYGKGNYSKQSSRNNKGIEMGNWLNKHVKRQKDDI